MGHSNTSLAAFPVAFNFLMRTPKLARMVVDMDDCLSVNEHLERLWS